MSVDLIQAILALDNKAQVSVTNIDSIKWWDGNPNNITKEQIQTKYDELVSLEPMRVLREERTKKLQETDWTQYRDVSLSNDSDWQTYRQSLRDLPSTAKPQLDKNGQLTNVTWPTKPS